MPRDLLAVVALGLLADAVVLLSPLGGALRVPLGLALALLAPGYAVVAALLPDRRADATHLALAVAASAVLTPLCGLLLSMTAIPFGALPLAVALTAVTYLAAAVAARRRVAGESTRPEADADAPADSSARSPDVGSTSRSWGALDVAFVALVVLAAASVGHAVLTPATGGASLSLTTPDGERVAADPGVNETVRVGVTNYGTSAATYTLVVQRQRVAAGNATRVLSRDERLRERFTVPAGATRHEAIKVADGPGRTRVVALLSEGDAPASPTAANADHETHVWVD
ncbi:hypothetical protein GCM10009017_08250 [Halarchaeum rubridurum]|uniref:DUF1616 domain-containing protein n=2 Tax=Halarchaeum rubridurum TaxID=489911 RepID=A0A830FTZ5_9EURY|nr:hypothetical protein GCM10009017_08250 [Halarchaeum rubridurum]